MTRREDERQSPADGGQRIPETHSPTGMGPGITGASGDLIDATGGDSGIGGTGHDDEPGATGDHPDERNQPSPQDVMEQADRRSTYDE